MRRLRQLELGETVKREFRQLRELFPQLSEDLLRRAVRRRGFCVPPGSLFRPDCLVLFGSQFIQTLQQPSGQSRT